MLSYVLITILILRRHLAGQLAQTRFTLAAAFILKYFLSVFAFKVWDQMLKFWFYFLSVLQSFPFTRILFLVPFSLSFLVYAPQFFYFTLSFLNLPPPPTLHAHLSCHRKVCGISIGTFLWTYWFYNKFKQIFEGKGREPKICKRVR